MTEKLIADMNEALKKLLDKYGIQNHAVFMPAVSGAAVEAFLKMSPGETPRGNPSQADRVFAETCDLSGAALAKTEAGFLAKKGQTLMLLPWRVERRFTELKNIATNGTLEDISTLRFCAISSKSSSSLEQLLYREFDLCEYLGGADIKSLFAVYNDKSAANVIVKLANGVNCSVECSVMLPPNAEEIDRHEIIARRGVASDRAVDTQIPQSSIYVFTNNGEKRFTDIDSELFGFAPPVVNLVRAARAVLSHPATGKTWNKQYKKLLRIVAAAVESDKNQKPISI